MWSTNEIKARGRAALKLNYWKCVLVSFIMGFVLSGPSSISSRFNTSSEESQQAMQELQESVDSLTPGQRIALAAGVAGVFTLVFVISLLIKIFLYNPLKVGGLAFFKRNVQDAPADLNEIGVGFRNYMHTFVTLFLNDLFLTLWTLLLIVPGIIKSYSYRMVPYILADEPELSPTETITRSRQMMDGHKWHTFCYDLSFIGWALLTILTCGLVGMFWFGPYKNNSDAALYLELRDGGMEPNFAEQPPVVDVEPAPVAVPTPVEEQPPVVDVEPTPVEAEPTAEAEPPVEEQPSVEAESPVEEQPPVDAETPADAEQPQNEEPPETAE